MSLDHDQYPNNNDYLSSSSSSSSSPSSSSSSSPKLDLSESEELRRMPLAPVRKNKKYLSKQLSMRETRQDVAWERRRRQILSQERRMSSVGDGGEDLTDEDLSELKGCIELGFGFNEEAGQRLCNILPALDLYLAVNRQMSFSPSSSPFSRSQRNSSVSLDTTRSSSFGSLSASESDWKICNPGDDPQQVKTKLRHWAQAVACSVLQSI